MDFKLIIAIIAITAALIFYTTGVFWERKTKVLNKNQVIVFWVGLFFDITGTTIMTNIANSGQVQIKSDFTQNIHSITGMLAIILMLLHAGWAAWVVYKDDIKRKKVFHKFSIFVWLVWLIPYFLGMFMGMMN
ncbi:HsmA family protein [Clostridium paridis]|uniref:TIGR03987 family protein n=1 Tax=Clostridium paridis TaxID=2803863 RepID=A0A937K4F8_9CLOT|nr:HsmA family protein [Clostridium paridis]MBL4931155.1 TIGR03987 family protein [Clostridium paridis]